MNVRRQYLPECIPLPGSVSGSGVSGVCVWTGLGSGSDRRPLAVTPCRSRLILACRPGSYAPVQSGVCPLLCSRCGSFDTLATALCLVSAAALFLLRDTWPALTDVTAPTASSGPARVAILCQSKAAPHCWGWGLSLRASLCAGQWGTKINSKQ